MLNQVNRGALAPKKTKSRQKPGLFYASYFNPSPFTSVGGTSPLIAARMLRTAINPTLV
jgi:hypothetical protein